MLNLMRGLMIVLCIAMVSCSSNKPSSTIHQVNTAHERVADSIKDIVGDKKRADDAVSIAEMMFEETKGFLDNVIESRKEAIELSEDYDTTREAFDAHYEIFFQQRKAHSKKYTALSIQLRKAVAESEWIKINAVLNKEMQKFSIDNTSKE
jgi:hypothetical protein